MRLVDSEVSSDVGNAVVGQHSCRCEGSAYVIGAARHCLACRSAVSRRHTICNQEAGGGCWWYSTAGSQRIRILGSIRFAVGVRRPSRRTSIDGEAPAPVGDAIVREHAGRSERGGDVIRAAQHRFACSTIVSGGHAIGRDEVRTTAGR